MQVKEALDAVLAPLAGRLALNKTRTAQSRPTGSGQQAVSPALAHDRAASSAGGGSTSSMRLNVIFGALFGRDICGARAPGGARS